MITAQQLFDKIKNVRVFQHRTLQNADGTPQRWRLNGEIKLYKRDPYRIRIPVKRGLYEYGRIESVGEFMDHFGDMLTESQ